MLCHMTVPSCRYLALPGRIVVRYKSPHLWEEGREKMLVTRRKMLGLSAATMGALALAACNNGGGSTTDELVAKCSLLADFKAVQNGHVWCVAQSFFQQSMELADFILELHRLFTEDAPDGLQYFIHVE